MHNNISLPVFSALKL